MDHPPVVPAKSFDELRVGDPFPLPSRTVTEAHFAAFQLLSGDTHPIHYDREYCQEQGHGDLLAHGFQVLLSTTAGAGIFPYVMGEKLMGFLEQSSQFLKPVYPGDTLYPILTIADLKRQNSSGVVTLDSTVHNQHGECCLTGIHRYLVRL